MLTKLAVFDVCDTLFKSNTTFDFIRFVLETEQKSFKRLLFRLYTFKYSPFFILFYLIQKINKKDVCKEQSLALLKGYSYDALCTLAQKFNKEVLDALKIEETHQLLETYKKAGCPVVLLSASIDPVIDVIAKEMGVQALSSKLSYSSKGVFEGRLAFEMTGKKQTKLEGFGYSASTELTVVSDNFTDKTLMALAKDKYAVVYSTEARKYWQELAPNYIDLSK